MSIFERFKLGFKKSASTFTSGLKEIIIKKEIDDNENIYMTGPVSNIDQINIKI